MRVSSGNKFVLNIDCIQLFFEVRPPEPAHRLHLQGPGYPCLPRASGLFLCDCFSRDVLVLQTVLRRLHPAPSARALYMPSLVRAGRAFTSQSYSPNGRPGLMLRDCNIAYFIHRLICGAGKITVNLASSMPAIVRPQPGHPRIHGWPAFVRPSTGSRPSTGGLVRG